MALTITAAIQRIKSDVAHWLTPDAIHSVCKAVDYTWRERVLDPVTTIHLFILQILHGNTACAHVPRLGGVDCTGEAYNQARGRLPLMVIRALLLLLGQRWPVEDQGGWKGHRTFLVDGSSVSMPDTPALQKEYGQPSAQAPGCGFPVMHLLALFNAATGLLLSIVSSPLRTHDMSQIGRILPELEKNDVVVGDRGLVSFAHLALLAARLAFGVFRAHQKQIVNFRPGRRAATRQSKKRGEKGLPTSRWLKRLGRHDQLVEYVKPKKRPKWMSEKEYEALPETLVVRELRYTVSTPGLRTKVFTLSTTLLDPKVYPASELADLYGQRWQIEVNFRHMKTTLGMEVLHCKTVEGVQKELAMYMLVYNLIRIVMLEAAKEQGVPVERISFVDAARWLAEAVHDESPLRLRVNPHRPGRSEPRVVKRRPKSYPLLKRPRKVLQKQLENKAKGA